MREELLSAVDVLRLIAEVSGGAVIAVGVLVSLIGFVRALAARREVAFTDVRLALGRYLALALELQLAADILSTSIAPSWDQLGKLATTAVIRTGLNFFLTRELREAGHRVSAQEGGGTTAGEAGDERPWPTPR